MTAQRRTILDVFLESGRHLTVDELYEAVSEKDPAIGRATVFRALKVLAACGLARVVRFDDGLVRYENAWGREHHDHMVCDVCGRSFEIEDPGIREALARVAEASGFKLTGHTAFLHGLCPDCRAAGE
ncbi:Fur family transcriptional regulator [Desulfocurvus sp. DL9XJH121]